MTKAPVAGASKTRLTPPLTANEAAKLSACFLRDTCDNIASVCLDEASEGVAVYTPAGTQAFFNRLLPASYVLIEQRGTLFGERLFHAAEDLLLSGYDSVCLIDSDSPTLPAAFLRAAVSALASPNDSLVLGPAKDGGYYLIGLKRAHRRVFDDIDWSTSKVLAQTIARAREVKLPVTILPSWFDVDDAASLRQLCYELFAKNGKRATHSVAYRAPYTRAYLSQLLVKDNGRQRLASAQKSARPHLEEVSTVTR
jgi:rSAM/selenodomain-associated transferase 1